MRKIESKFLVKVGYKMMKLGYKLFSEFGHYDTSECRLKVSLPNDEKQKEWSEFHDSL